MIRRSAIIASTIAVLVVAGCSGSDDDGANPNPTPTPTPTASATPTYAAFPLSAVTEFFSVSASLSYTGDAAAGPVTLGTAATDGFSNRVRFALQNTVTPAATSEVVVREAGQESRFTGADLLTAPAPTVTEYVFRETTAPTTPGGFAQLDLLNNTVSATPSVITNDPALALTRSSYGGWWRGESTAGVKRATYATFGYPTVASDMPTTGTVSYTVRVAGRSVVSPTAGASADEKLGGTATLTINYATGLVTLNMTLTRGTGAVPYGTFTGTGAIAAGNTQFTGSFGTGSAAGGTFQGLAYGTQAAEVGISFAISGAVAAGDSRAVGVVVGKKS